MSTIAIPIEIKSREFHGKLYLSAVLAKDGHKVALGDKNHLRNILFEEIKPDIYISKSMNKSGAHEEIFQKIQQYGGNVAVLDAEGGFGGTRDLVETRIWPKLLDYIDVIFAWGQLQAEAITSQTNISERKICVTGNPRFDLLQSDLRNFYYNHGKRHRQKYGNFVLINTNFGTVNPYSEERQKKIQDELDIKRTTQEINYKSKLFNAFLNMATVLNKNTDKEIVIRPHPGENHKTYYEIFGNIEGVHIEPSGDVREWIAGSAVVVHNNCTTGIESALMNKQVLSFEPSVGVSPPYEFSVANFISNSVRSVDKLVAIVEKADAEVPYTLSSNQEDRIKKRLYNIHEKAAHKIRKKINRIEKESEQMKPPKKPLKKRIKTKVKKQPIAPHIQRIRGNTREKEGKSKQKIPDLGLEEVHSELSRLNISDECIRARQVNYIDDVFWITQK